jgi:hypothetical protein
VASGELVALGDLALGRDVDADHVVDARRQLVAVRAAEALPADDDAALAVGDLQRGVAHLARLLPEDRAQQALLRRELGLALRRDLADEDVARGDLRTDAHDAFLVEVGEHALGDVGDVRGDLLGTELRLAGVDLELLDVDRREHVVLDEPLGEDDRVLEVVALPGHERDEQVAAERQLAVVGRRTVGEHAAGLDPVTLGDDRTLVDARALVGALELRQRVAVDAVGVGAHDDAVRRDLDDDARLAGADDVAGVLRGLALDAGADVRRLGTQQRHGLALHVRAHQGAVRVVVLEERDERRRQRHDLARRDVHVVHGVRRDLADLAALGADEHERVDELAGLRVDRRVRLGDDVPVLLVGGQVVDLVGDLALDDLAVRRLDEAVLVDARVRRERADEADVRTLRRLDRAHAAVVRRVDVADLEAGALTRQTTRAERREAPLVGDARRAGSSGP